MKHIDLRSCERVPLTEDDFHVLETIYQSRIRTAGTVFALLTLLLCWKGWAFMAQIGTTEPEGLIALLLYLGLVPGPALAVFFRYVQPYRLDQRAGFKYLAYEQIIRKEYFPHTGQYFISLDDVAHMHHEVSHEDYAVLEAGQRYPVYFAAHSRYPFTLRSRITAM